MQNVIQSVCIPLECCPYQFRVVPRHGVWRQFCLSLAAERFKKLDHSVITAVSAIALLRSALWERGLGKVGGDENGIAQIGTGSAFCGDGLYGPRK